MFSLVIEVFRFRAQTLMENLTQQFFILVFSMATTLVFVFNSSVASMTDVNESIPKYLYPIFSHPKPERLRHGRKLKTHSNRLFNARFNRNTELLLKIDSFIVRLNEQYVGFHCLNMFKFTKFSFYEYIFSMASAYMLIKSL